MPYFLEKLKRTPDGDGTLLDHTLIIYGSPMGDSNVHNHKRCPLFFAGHAGGRLKGGLHLKAADGTPMANVMLTALHTLGLDDMETFGDSSGTFDLNAGFGQGSGFRAQRFRSRMARTVRAFLGGLAGACCLAGVLHAAGPARLGGRGGEGRRSRHRARAPRAGRRRQPRRRRRHDGAALGGEQGRRRGRASAGRRRRQRQSRHHGSAPYTPLHLAAQAGSAPIIALLAAHGAAVDAVTLTGATPLMFAAADGDPVSVKALLDAGANPNATELARGQTPLMFAAAADRLDAARVLLAHGADPNAETKVVDLAALSRDGRSRWPQSRPAGGRARRRGPCRGAGRWTSRRARRRSRASPASIASSC